MARIAERMQVGEHVLGTARYLNAVHNRRHARIVQLLLDDLREREGSAIVGIASIDMDSEACSEKATICAPQNDHAAAATTDLCETVTKRSACRSRRGTAGL